MGNDYSPNPVHTQGAPSGETGGAPDIPPEVAADAPGAAWARFFITWLEQRFVQIDQRFMQIDQRFTQIDQRFTQIDQRFDEQDRRSHELNTRLSRLEGILSGKRQVLWAAGVVITILGGTAGLLHLAGVL